MKKNRLRKIVNTKTSEKCIPVNEKTGSFLAKSDKLQKLQKEQFEKHQVLIYQEITEPRNIWIVSEESKINNAEQELIRLTDENNITSASFNHKDAIKFRFLCEHCWDTIKEKERRCEAEGVTVLDFDANLFTVEGTQVGRAHMIKFLQGLVEKVDFKVYIRFCSSSF